MTLSYLEASIQQTAASVEELAQTANFLDSNAEKLNEVMSFFKVA